MDESEANRIKEKLVKDNPLSKHCSACNHNALIYGTTACIDGKPEEWFIVYGSDADFCTECDNPW